jgi:hypothetical protein
MAISNQRKAIMAKITNGNENKLALMTWQRRAAAWRRARNRRWRKRMAEKRRRKIKRKHAANGDMARPASRWQWRRRGAAAAAALALASIWLVA